MIVSNGVWFICRLMILLRVPGGVVDVRDKLRFETILVRTEARTLSQFKIKSRCFVDAFGGVEEIPREFFSSQCVDVVLAVRGMIRIYATYAIHVDVSYGLVQWHNRLTAVVSRTE